MMTKKGLERLSCAAGKRSYGSFRALVVSKPDKKSPAVHDIQQVDSFEQLPMQREVDKVVVDVSWSTINYKDAMVLQGQPGVAKSFPIVPGIDFAGSVVEDPSGVFKAGEKVVLTGNYAGQHCDGGYSQKVRINPDWLVRLPETFTEREGMIIGTAGFTAMQSVMAIEKYVENDKDAPILVTGASGGVGSTAVSILSNLGYKNIVASTRRNEENGNFLKNLGATQVIGGLDIENKRPMNKENWQAVIDSVGGSTLAQAVTEVKYSGVVACCGVAAGPKVNTSVFPFILRGVSLLGIDSVQLPMEDRKQVWRRLEKDFPRKYFEQDTMEVGLEELDNLSKQMLQGKVKGRVLVQPNPKSNL